MFYLIWVPAFVLYLFGYSWLSIKNNQPTDLVWYQSKWLWITFFYGALCPIWIIISRMSKNLVFDGMLYDILMILTFSISMIALGRTESFNKYQWIGMVVVFTGFVLMHMDQATLNSFAKLGFE